MRFVGHFLLLSVSAFPVQAQFFEFLADWSDASPLDNRPLIADVTATLRAHSPWGDINSVESGKYWRNSLGQDRFDDAYGLSAIRDRRSPPIRVRIDRQLGLVDIEEKASSASRTPADPWSILPFNYGEIGKTPKGQEKIVEGLIVTVRTGEDHGVSYEVWISKQLGIVVFVRYKTESTTFEQRIHHIRFAEPDPQIVSFEVPTGFRTHITCWSETAPEWEAPRQSYLPGKDSCK
jgi:hypothetical protein